MAVNRCNRHGITCLLLQAGDALFIPEGWWHQVDSQETTIAVNFWWQSAFRKGLQGQAHMQQYYLRSLLDAVLDTERCRALACVQPHPTVQALQAAVDTVMGCRASQASDITTSDTSRTSLATTNTSDTATASAVAAAARPAEKTEQSAAAAAAAVAAALSQPASQERDLQHGHCQSITSQQWSLPAIAPARQSEVSLVDISGSCNTRKRKAAHMSHGCRSVQADTAYQQSPQAMHPRRCHDAQHATSGQRQEDVGPPLSQSNVSPLGEGVSAADESPPEHAEDSMVDADCAGHQEKEPVHMACMQLLAGAVADCLNRPDTQDASMGKPAKPVTGNSVAQSGKVGLA